MKAIERYDSLTADIEKEEARVEVCKEMMVEKKQLEPSTPGAWLGFLAILLVATLLFSSLFINMGRLFGWWTIEQFDALLETLRATLVGLGGGEGPLSLVGTVVWWLIEIVTAILIAFPLKVFQLIEVIVPDAETFMGFVDGAILLGVFWLVISSNPASKVPVYTSREKDVILEEMHKAQAKVRDLEAQRSRLVESAGIQDYASKQ